MRRRKPSMSVARHPEWFSRAVEEEPSHDSRDRRGRYGRNGPGRRAEGGGDELRAAYHSPPKAEKARAQGAIYQPAGDAQISHIDVRDIARVAARVLTTGGHEAKAYELSGPQALSYDEAAGILSGLLDRRISYVALSDDEAKAGMLAAGMPDFYADHMLNLFRAYRTGVASQVTADVKAVTGREPLAFEQFARDYADAFR